MYEKGGLGTFQKQVHYPVGPAWLSSRKTRTIDRVLGRNWLREPKKSHQNVPKRQRQCSQFLETRLLLEETKTERDHYFPPEMETRRRPLFPERDTKRRSFLSQNGDLNTLLTVCFPGIKWYKTCNLREIMEWYWIFPPWCFQSEAKYHFPLFSMYYHSIDPCSDPYSDTDPYISLRLFNTKSNNKGTAVSYTHLTLPTKA